MSEWISVKERLPEHFQQVLALDSLENYTVLTFYTDSYFGDRWMDDEGEMISLSWVAHWMPLPEPPKEDTE